MVTYAFTGELQPEQVRSHSTKHSRLTRSSTPAKAKGIPVTIMEALHAGIPVVAPAIGGIPSWWIAASAACTGRTAA